MNKRFHELDSLRGLAALTVVFSHFMLVYNFNFIDTQSLGIVANWHKHTPIHLFWAGGEAVMLFFILSGFVLFLPFSKGRPFSYQDYMVKRIFRIYPASIVALLLAVFLFLMSSNNFRLVDSQWINGMWANDLTAKSVLSDILLMGYNGSGLNPVLWSLIHEIRLSFVFPVIAFVVMKYNWKKVLPVAVAVSMIGYILMTVLGADITSASSTLHLSGTFVVGALLAKYKDSIIRKVSLIKSIVKFIGLLIGIVLYTMGWIMNNESVFHNNFVINWLTTIGASIFIVLSLSSFRLSKLLKHGVILFFGKISFSLYLYHMIFLIYFIKIDLGSSMPITLMLTFVVSVIVSALSYKYIELPTISLGKITVPKFKKKILIVKK